MLGIGVDLCAIDRMERAIEKEHFLSRIFTPQERAYMDARGRLRASSAAAMFAAKEAVAKALYTGFGNGVMPGMIEVTHDADGAPGVNLYDGALRRLEEMGGGRVLLSLSHEGNMAIAFVTIEAKDKA